MKKFLLIAAVILGISTAKGQENKTSIVGGYTNFELTVKAEFQGESDSESDDVNGFFIGLKHDFDLKENLSFQPGFLYTRITDDETDESDVLLQIPLLLKYQASEVFSLLAGSKIDYLTGLEDDEKEIINEFSFSLVLGLEFDIAKNFAIVGNYSFQLNNAYAGDFVDEAENVGAEISGKYNILNLGLAYKF